ncbi:Uncharacterised protein [Burkholderia pseudomallei]|nr:Uncharacterised protein [Burkholderia pseudomallei]
MRDARVAGGLPLRGAAQVARAHRFLFPVGPGTERAHTIAQRVPPPAARVPGIGDGGPRAPR